MNELPRSAPPRDRAAQAAAHRQAGSAKVPTARRSPAAIACLLYCGFIVLLGAAGALYAFLPGERSIVWRALATVVSPVFLLATPAIPFISLFGLFSAKSWREKGYCLLALLLIVGMVVAFLIFARGMASLR